MRSSKDVKKKVHDLIGDGGHPFCEIDVAFRVFNNPRVSEELARVRALSGGPNQAAQNVSGPSRHH